LGHTPGNSSATARSALLFKFSSTRREARGKWRSRDSQAARDSTMTRTVVRDLGGGGGYVWFGGLLVVHNAGWAGLLCWDCTCNRLASVDMCDGMEWV
jgi:hypothetical protein